MIRSESTETNLDYCVQITSNQNEDGKQHLRNFCNVKKTFPVIAVTSKLMTTGVDAQMCKVIVLDTNVNSKTELKQIIGRGTRLYTESTEMSKYYFTIIDFRKSTENMGDDDWDSPDLAKDGIPKTEESDDEEPDEGKQGFRPIVEGDKVEVISKVTTFYDPDSKTKYKYSEVAEYMGKSLKKLGGEIIEDFKNLWLDLDRRDTLITEFKKIGISLENIREIEELTKDEYDLFDVFVKMAYGKEPKLRKLRAEQAKQDKIFFEKYPKKAQEVLNILLDHYAEYGYTQLVGREVLQLDKFEKVGGYREILTKTFESPPEFDNAVKELMIRIYK